MTSFKKITEYDKFALDAAVEGAVSHCKEHGLDFYTILKGVDAYMERRRRKNNDEREAVEGARNHHAQIS